ncbi:hypothetical protein C8R44DRAFT_849374 [Mycena epipterygia]|nr:hypothetical protein C8R44DRAFT_849374 [Mycena epipterygia]
MLIWPFIYVSALVFLVCTNALVLTQIPRRDIHTQRSAVRALEYTIPRSPECVACAEVHVEALTTTRK